MPWFPVCGVVYPFVGPFFLFLYACGAVGAVAGDVGGFFGLLWVVVVGVVVVACLGLWVGSVG